MFGFSFWEIVVTAVVALLVFGPEKLPELARQGGKFLGQFRKTSDALRRDFYNAVYSPSEEINRLKEAAKRELLTLPTTPPKSASAATDTTFRPEFDKALEKGIGEETHEEDELGSGDLGNDDADDQGPVHVPSPLAARSKLVKPPGDS